MADIIDLDSERTTRQALTSATGIDDAQVEAQVVAFLADSLENLKASVLGANFTTDTDLRSIERFFYNHLVSRFRALSDKFLSYLYLSRMAARHRDIEPVYLSDVMQQPASASQAMAQRIADMCFVLAGLFPEWIARRGAWISRQDYIRIGQSYYGNAAARAHGQREQMFRDLARGFQDYADAVYEARQVLLPSAG